MSRPLPSPGSLALGWRVARGLDIAPDTPSTDRTNYGVMLLEQRLRDVLLPELFWGGMRGEVQPCMEVTIERSMPNT